MPKGDMSVSVGSTVTCDNGMLSSFAQHCASIVKAPWPISHSPVTSVTRPSGAILAITVEPSQLPNSRLPLTWIAVPKPMPRRLMPVSFGRFFFRSQPMPSLTWSRHSDRPLLPILKP